jgi:phospholipid/cholesterol/gamma-HCH transport system substrate-binding protein
VRASLTRTIIKLVVFFAICSVFTAYLAFTIGNIRLFRHTYTLKASFDDATGLLPNDNVKVAGVIVGKVRKVAIDQGRASVQFSVRTSTKLPTDSTAAIRWRNLLGQRYLYMYPGEASTVLRGGERVTKTRSIVDVGELFNRLGPIIKAVDPKQVNTFLDTIVGALDGNDEKLRQSIDDLAIVVKTLGDRDQAIGRLIDNVNVVTGAINDRDAQIRTILDNLVTISGTFSANTKTLNAAVDDLGDFSKNLGSILDNNRTEVDAILHNLVTITDLVRSKLGVVDHAVAGLDSAAKSLFNASRFGEWLNQVIPCGSVAGVANVNSPCVTGGPAPAGASSAPTSAPSAIPPAVPTKGAVAVAQLLTP